MLSGIVERWKCNGRICNGRIFGQKLRMESGVSCCNADCGKPLNKPLRCSICKAVFYCSKECQVSWYQTGAAGVVCSTAISHTHTHTHSLNHTHTHCFILSQKGAWKKHKRTCTPARDLVVSEVNGPAGTVWTEALTDHIRKRHEEAPSPQQMRTVKKVCVCTKLDVHTHTHTHTHECIYIRAEHTHTHTDTDKCVTVCVCIYVHMYKVVQTRRSQRLAGGYSTGVRGVGSGGGSPPHLPRGGGVCLQQPWRLFSPGGTGSRSPTQTHTHTHTTHTHTTHTHIHTKYAIYYILHTI
jgi:hypothetical protein